MCVYFTRLVRVHGPSRSNTNEQTEKSRPLCDLFGTALVTARAVKLLNLQNDTVLLYYAKTRCTPFFIFLSNAFCESLSIANYTGDRQRRAFDSHTTHSRHTHTAEDRSENTRRVTPNQGDERYKDLYSEGNLLIQAQKPNFGGYFIS